MYIGMKLRGGNPFNRLKNMVTFGFMYPTKVNVFESRHGNMMLVDDDERGRMKVAKDGHVSYDLMNGNKKTMPFELNQMLITTKKKDFMNLYKNSQGEYFPVVLDNSNEIKCQCGTLVQKGNNKYLEPMDVDLRNWFINQVVHESEKYKPKEDKLTKLLPVISFFAVFVGVGLMWFFMTQNFAEMAAPLSSTAASFEHSSVVISEALTKLAEANGAGTSPAQQPITPLN